MDPDPGEPTILIVDDSEIIRRALGSLLRKGAFERVQTADSAAAAWDLLLNEGDGGVDLVLADIHMPDTSGVEFCRQLKADDRMAAIPVIMITAQDDEDSLASAFEAGATDYITKPPRPYELWARIRSALTLKAEMDRRRQREAELMRSTRQLAEANRQLERISMLDGLTGIANRRMFDRLLDQEWRRGQRGQHPVGLLLIDIDEFKRYNDTYGHLQGDLCLKAVAAAIEYALHRPGDTASRYGGEEFAVVLPDTDAEGVLAVGERLRQAVQELQLGHSASAAATVVTVSVGAAVRLPGEAERAEVLVADADERLYAAKAAGRNAVRGPASEPAEPSAPASE